MVEVGIKNKNSENEKYSNRKQRILHLTRSRLTPSLSPSSLRCRPRDMLSWHDHSLFLFVCSGHDLSSLVRDRSTMTRPTSAVFYLFY